MDEITEVEVFTNYDRNKYGKGDFVTRIGEDIHYVLEYSDQWANGHFICIVPDGGDIYNRGEVESNLTRRYSKINKYFLPFAKKELEFIKTLFPHEFNE